MDTRPIGVYDSGLGGLTVVKELRKKLPSEDIVYLGDTARVPYGPRSKDVVVKFSLQDAYFLAGQGVKLIVIACNTSSAWSYKEVKERLALPILDVINAGAIGAVKATKNEKVAVVGTKGTIASHAYKEAIGRLKPEISVYEKDCPLLVPLIEEGEIDGRLIKLVAKKYLSPLKEFGVDTLVLGCTHYPIVASVLKGAIGDKVTIVDPAAEIVKKLLSYLKTKGLRSGIKRKAHTKYYVTDLNDSYIKTAEMFLGEEIVNNIDKVELE